MAMCSLVECHVHSSKSWQCVHWLNVMSTVANHADVFIGGMLCLQQ